MILIINYDKMQVPKGYVKPKQACKMLQVSVQTLRRWEKEGRIETKRENSDGSHRTYNVRKYLKEKCGFEFNDEPHTGGDYKYNFIYCRVSTNSQKGDLDRQVKFLQEEYPDYKVIKDIASGLNFKRKGLRSILEHVKTEDIGEVVVAHKDRLCRFGFDLLKYFIESAGGKIVVYSDDKEEQEISPEQELCKDIISIITVFSSRLYGLRKYKKKIKEEYEGK